MGMNLVARPEFQIGTQAFYLARARGGRAREKSVELHRRLLPCSYADYQGWTERVLPLVMMKCVEPIPVFKFEDAEGWRDD